MRSKLSIPNPGDTTVIRVAGSPEVPSSYTGDQALLRDAINAFSPAAPAPTEAALTVAAGNAGSVNFNVVIVGDGGRRIYPSPAIPGTLRYPPVGRADDNLAISARQPAPCPVSRRSCSRKSLTMAATTPRSFSLRVDGNLIIANESTVPANRDVAVVSQNLPDQFKTIEAGLTLPVNSTFMDYLQQDNTAWAVSSDTGSRRVLLMSEGNLFLEQVLRSIPSVQLVVGSVSRGLPTQPFDLYVFDGWMPATLPEGDMMFVNPPRSNALFAVGATSQQVGNPRVQRDDPRMTFVDFSSVNLLEFRQVAASWAEPLIFVDGGALLLAGETGGRQVSILTFDLRNSDLPLQIQWPILMSALLNWYSPQNLLNAPEGLRVGDTLALTPLADTESVRVTLPDGSTRDLPFNEQNPSISFADTGSPGLYTVDALSNGEIIQTASFAVNLFDSNESRIAPRQTISLGGTQVTQAVEAEIGQREYWTILALLALLFLLIEWFAYHRRLHAPTIFRPLTRREA